MDNFTTSSNSISPLSSNINEIKEALYRANSLVNSMPKKIHMTIDFFNQLKNNKEASYTRFINEDYKTGICYLSGIPLQIHYEPCERQWWADYENDMKNIIAFGWVYNKGRFIERKNTSVSLTSIT